MDATYWFSIEVSAPGGIASIYGPYTFYVGCRNVEFYNLPNTTTNLTVGSSGSSVYNISHEVLNRPYCVPSQYKINQNYSMVYGPSPPALLPNNPSDPNCTIFDLNHTDSAYTIDFTVEAQITLLDGSGVENITSPTI